MKELVVKEKLSDSPNSTVSYNVEQRECTENDKQTIYEQ